MAPFRSFATLGPTVMFGQGLNLLGVLVLKGYENFRKVGRFRLADGRELQGELRLRGEATILELYSDSPNSPLDEQASTDISGLFYDGSEMSLIDCVVMSESVQGGVDTHYRCTSVFPHFVIFGSSAISSSGQTVSKMSFTMEDAPAIFHDADTFGSVIDVQPYLDDILEAEAERRGREIRAEEHPHLFYFTGKHKIFEVSTAIGKISATNHISYVSPNTTGIQVNNTIKLNIAFNVNRTVEAAANSILDLLRFFEIIAGRPQNISNVSFSPVGAENYFKFFDVYWCTPPHRTHDSDSSQPRPRDLPLQATANTDEFSSVLKMWIKRNDEWRSARSRFSTAFSHQSSYTTDRIVGAANMFDILPSHVYQKQVTLPPDILEAKEKARKLFKELPQSLERESVLNALGRVGKPTLKRKVRSRARLITDVVGNRFPDLDLVINQAIDCRNYFVHGSEAKIDYSTHSSQVIFFTDTLEFIFAASDLLESGWNISHWITRHSTNTHPFSRYCFSYQHRLSELKTLIQRCREK